MRRTRGLVSLVFFSLVAVGISYTLGQDHVSFTVASIKPSGDNFPGMVIRQLPNGGYSAQKITLGALLTSAYTVSPQRLIGIPNWGNTDRYDIEARYDGPDHPAPPLNLLLQGFLRERFGLKVHTDKRDFPVYFLRSVAKDGSPGHGMTRSSNKCADTTQAAGTRQSNQQAANGAPLCSAIERPDAFIAGGVSMDIFARSLRIPSGRDVINDTGLSGVWEFSLEFAPPADTTGEKPDIFTALKDQLGLKLEAGTAALDVLVIDVVNRPTPN
jgi:uncharacterized protein (TIGR03435 family)